MDLSGRRVALALGGGGARGCAHIGVIDELAARGAEIVALAGTSMGAVIGGVHAVGQLDAYSTWLSSLTQRDVLRLLDPSLRSPGMINGDKVMQRIRDLIGDVRIEDLPIPYTAVATDLLTGKEVWFQSGPLDMAIRASIALPSVFTPLLHEGRMLVDGGLLNNVPVSPLAAAHFDLLVVVDVGGAPHTALGQSRHHVDAEFDAAQKDAMQARDQDVLRRVLSRLGWERPDASEVGNDAGRSASEPQVASVRTVDVMELSIQVMQRLITRFQTANYPADISIQLPTDMCGTMEFHRAKDVIARGRAAAVAAFDA